MDRTEPQSQDGLATERSVVEGPSGDLITRNALEAIARGDVLREVARRVFGDTRVGERIAEVEVKGRRGRVIHLQLDTLTDGLPDRATDLAAVGSYTEIGADHIVQRDMVGGGVKREFVAEIQMQTRFPLATRQRLEALELFGTHLMSVSSHIDYLGREGDALGLEEGRYGAVDVEARRNVVHSTEAIGQCGIRKYLVGGAVEELAIIRIVDAEVTTEEVHTYPRKESQILPRHEVLQRYPIDQVLEDLHAAVLHIDRALIEDRILQRHDRSDASTGIECAVRATKIHIGEVVSSEDRVTGIAPA